MNAIVRSVVNKRVALNRGCNALRGQRRAQQRVERMADPAPQIDLASELERSEDRASACAAIAELPERQGRLLLLRYAGLAYSEIAEALGIAPGSVGTLLARAERAFLSIYQRQNVTGAQQNRGANDKFL